MKLRELLGVPSTDWDAVTPFSVRLDLIVLLAALAHELRNIAQSGFQTVAEN